MGIFTIFEIFYFYQPQSQISVSDITHYLMSFVMLMRVHNVFARQFQESTQIHLNQIAVSRTTLLLMEVKGMYRRWEL